MASHLTYDIDVKGILGMNAAGNPQASPSDLPYQREGLLSQAEVDRIMQKAKILC